MAKNRSVFSRLSLVIDVADDWCEPNTLVLRHPAKHDPKRSRIVMHETLHWWQQLGHGFLTFFAAEDWQRLKEFETNGIIPSFGYYSNEFYYEYPYLGFNAFTLNEALTRFWDIHICGPIELLEMEGANINYFDPYIPEIPKTRKYKFDLKSININSIEENYYDAAVIITNHSNIDYEKILIISKSIIDTRNAIKNCGNKPLYKAEERVISSRTL